MALNRARFLRGAAAVVVAPAVLELEKWHGVASSAAIAADPVAAVAEADLATHLSVHRSYSELLLREYLPVVQEHLNQHRGLLEELAR